MREIKFRGKTIKDEKWVYGNLSSYPDLYLIEYQYSIAHIKSQVIKETIGEFTGCFDKKGNEIYEGDVVSGCEFNGTFCYGIVIFKRGHFFVVPVIRFGEGYDEITNVSIEVIGNIIDNPDYDKRQINKN